MCIRFETRTGVSRPIVDPRDTWIAYGVVFDNDGDGQPDVRWGIDNTPDDSLRAWSTDLRTGITRVVRGSRTTFPDHGRLWEAEFPFESNGDRSRRGYASLHPDLSGPDGRFYVWSAVIRDGRIVATDFAPDAGWIDGRPDATTTPDVP